MLKKLAATIIMTAVPVFAQQPKLALIERADFGCPAVTSLGERILSARQLSVEFVRRNGQKQAVVLLIFFDASTKHFLSYFGFAPTAPNEHVYRPGDCGSEFYLYSDPERLTLVTIISPRLAFRESSAAADDIYQAEASALKQASIVLSEGVTGFEWWAKGVIYAPFGDLGDRFFAPLLSPIKGPVSLIGIEKGGENWKVTIKGQWKELLTLNGKYEIIGKARLD